MRLAGLVLLSAMFALTSACRPFGSQLDIHDAARIYAENPEVFHRIRQQFPGPLDEARRIPAFESSEDKAEEIAFLEELKESIPVEILQVYRYRPDGPDAIDVVLGRYGLAVSGKVVGLIFFEDAVPEALSGSGIKVFDDCDERATRWLRDSHKRSFSDAYCRVDDNWYAYEHIT